ncbi:hypothetical protein LMG27952_06620 [Paraburkholderia hiiakae]|uniref:Uncharacterized protein n=1 Tax=Paraburkholderia hiiakae TaxID=1081782 RepID=A0ABN7IBU3_9BURK|nr:hypothetical protein [Paraburkholderia hiiakae]CAD6558497.1 hypothetical protein LMG27952_06620 [Paraburkholderia hiiakae]
MKMVTRDFLLGMVLGACSLAVQTSYAVTGVSSECAIGVAGKFAIKEYKNKMVSVCPADGGGDCLYTVTYGKTFVDSRIHLNSDHLNDYVIKDFSTGYGNDDVAHFMLFAQCRDGNFVQVVDDFFTTVKPDAMDRMTGWLKLRVTRDCYSESIGDTQERSYTIVFDPKRKKYGPPDSNPKLTHYCSDAELALPADSASTPE